MAKQHYLPNDDKGREAWLKNFNAKIGTYATGTGISPTEVTNIGEYYAMLVYIIGMFDNIKSFSKDVTAFKKLLMNAVVGTVLGPVPVFTVVAPPVLTQAGIFTIIAAIVKRIKASPNYTLNMGKDLGIIGSDIIIDYSKYKPVLKLTTTVDGPKAKYIKQKTSGIKLYADHDDGKGMSFFKFINLTTFTDTTALADKQTTALFQYFGVFVVDDAEVGIKSDLTTISVIKK